MGQMIPKQPLIIIIWIYQEMMVWMSRKPICILYSLMEDFGSEVGRLIHEDHIVGQTPATNPTHHDLHGPDDSQTTIHYHHLDLSRDDNGMDEQETYLYFVLPDGEFWLRSWAAY
jgi:hypothetical protein